MIKHSLVMLICSTDSLDCYPVRAQMIKVVRSLARIVASHAFSHFLVIFSEDAHAYSFMATRTTQTIFQHSSD